MTRGMSPRSPRKCAAAGAVSSRAAAIVLLLPLLSSCPASSHLPDESDDLAQDSEVRTLRVHQDGLHGGMLRLQHDRAVLHGEALHRRLVIDQGRDDVA